jgi:hypothetical protein
MAFGNPSRLSLEREDACGAPRGRAGRRKISRPGRTRARYRQRQAARGVGCRDNAWLRARVATAEDSALCAYRRRLIVAPRQTRHRPFPAGRVAGRCVGEGR